MRIQHFLLFVWLVLLLNRCCSQPTANQTDENSIISTIAENLEDYPLRVLNFHTSNRCQLCLTIEGMVRETVLVEYKEAIESGALKLYILNVERTENRKTAEEYFAFGSALFISSGKGNSIQTTDLTNEAFLYAQTNPDRFLETLRSTINQHLE